jgi:predicted Fe-Mo cluster-binding NifX family protein
MYRRNMMKRLISTTLLILLLVSILAFAEEEKMGKIAVASEDKNPTAPVSSRIGRSPFYLLFDWKGTFVEAIDNPYNQAREAPGKSLADSLRVDEKGVLIGGIEKLPRDERDQVRNSMISFLTRKNVKVIVAEEFGDEIIKAMKGKGIDCFAFKGSAAEAVQKILKSN